MHNLRHNLAILRGYGPRRCSRVPVPESSRAGGTDPPRWSQYEPLQAEQQQRRDRQDHREHLPQDEQLQEDKHQRVDRERPAPHPQED